MFWDWLHRLLYWRQIRDERLEMEAMVDNWQNMSHALDQRIAKAFTREEWEAVRYRCEQQLNRKL